MSDPGPSWSSCSGFYCSFIFQGFPYFFIFQGFPCFWPKDLDTEVKYGPIGVKYVGCQKYPHIIIRAFAIRKVGWLQSIYIYIF